VSVAGATTITGRIAQRHGRAVDGLRQLGLTHLFPPATVLASADLAGLGLTNARIDAIRAFADAVAHDHIRLDRSVPLDRLVDSITAVPGLGPWTAHYLALRMGEPDAFPTSDLGLRRAAAGLTGRAEPVSVTELRALAESWRPWRAVAATHLWATAPPLATARRHGGARADPTAVQCPIRA
jgi:3-methyladenine DNA glycosylase/8-oxoguanine DNA glycosylase